MKKVFYALLMSILVMLLAAACTPGKYRLAYEVEEETAAIWPPPPDIPRYRYVGQIFGEQNVEKVSGEEQGWFSRFWRKLAGLDSEKTADRLVLQRPQTGTVDDKDRILVTDVSRRSVVVFDSAAGKVEEWKAATPTQDFNTPVGIVIDSAGNILVSDAELARVFVLDNKGMPIRSFGEKILVRPTGMAYDPVLRQIFVADTHAHDIKVFSEQGDLVDLIGHRGTKIGEFNSPTHLAFAREQLYITDTFNTRVQILTRSGDFKQQFGERGVYVGNLVRPKGVTTDSDGNIYVIESFYDHLLIYNDAGQLLLPLGGSGQGVGQFYLPSGLWVDKRDRIYIADMFNGRIVILQYLGGKNQPAQGVR